MSETGRTWAIVLGAGDGTRLSALTVDARGFAVPKQFCSVNGGPSLLRQAIRRAERVVHREQVVVVVAAAHRRWWEPELCHFPPGNAIVQPHNRGTAIGILLPLMAVLERDPEARLLILPSDHQVQDEGVMSRAMTGALEAMTQRPEMLVLLGISPDGPDPEYGWILPAEAWGDVHGVRCFVEKPEQAVAQRLLAAGGLWNSFIIGAQGQAIVNLFERRAPGLVARLRGVLETEPERRAAAYERIAALDFSKGLLQGSEERLVLLPVPPCGWTDLGTPERVAGYLERYPAPRPAGPAPVDLAFALGVKSSRSLFAAKSEREDLTP